MSETKRDYLLIDLLKVLVGLIIITTMSLCYGLEQQGSCGRGGGSDVEQQGSCGRGGGGTSNMDQPCDKSPATDKVSEICCLHISITLFISEFSKDAWITINRTVLKTLNLGDW